jgi:hypothetical protein
LGFPFFAGGPFVFVKSKTKGKVQKAKGKGLAPCGAGLAFGSPWLWWPAPQFCGGAFLGLRE